MVPADDLSDIVDERCELQAARRRKLAEGMEPYDAAVYRPALRALQERCAARGHGTITRSFNFFHTVEWRHCTACRGLVTTRELGSEEAKSHESG